MQSIKNKIKTCFNKAVQTYDDNCKLQITVGKNLLRLSKKHIINSHNILDLGCGTGYVTQHLAKKFNHQNLYALDIADNLLKKTATRLAAWHVKILSADFDCIPLDDQVIDMVFSNMALQWSSDIAVTLNEINRVLSSRGFLTFNMPISGTLQELLKIQQFPDYFISQSMLLSEVKTAGYQILEIKQLHLTVYFDDIIDLVLSLKKVGANYKTSTQKTLLTKNYFKNLEIKYLNQFGTKNNQLPLTYVILCVIAQKY